MRVCTLTSAFPIRPRAMPTATAVFCPMLCSHSWENKDYHIRDGVVPLTGASTADQTQLVQQTAILNRPRDCMDVHIYSNVSCFFSISVHSSWVLEPFERIKDTTTPSLTDRHSGSFPVLSPSAYEDYGTEASSSFELLFPSLKRNKKHLSCWLGSPVAHTLSCP
ncbi:unnamed protein product [Arctogadus glacialis]